MRVVYSVNVSLYGSQSIIFADRNTALAFAMCAYGVGDAAAEADVACMPYITEETNYSEVKKLSEAVYDA